MRILIGVLLSTSLLTIGIVQAQNNEGVVQATGEAMIQNGDTVTAKKAAIADALKKCIEQVVGITIQSEFTSNQQETLKNNQTEFYSKVRDEILQKSDGFIQKHEVVQEIVQNNVLKITVRAHVFESKVRAEAKKLADLLKAAGNPKLMLVIHEVHIQVDGSEKMARESLFSGQLEKELIGRGFELRGKKAGQKAVENAGTGFDSWVDKNAADLAQQEGADIIIAGRIDIRDKGKIEDTAGFAALKGMTRIEINAVIRGVNATSGEVFSTKPVQMSSMGQNLERAVFRAFSGQGNNLVKQVFDDLLNDLKTSFEKTANQGQNYMVQLQGVKSFRKEGQTFLNVLRDLEGVSAVRQKSFQDGLLVLEVEFKGNPQQLQQKIFSASEQKEELTSLDIQNVSGKKLSFKL